MNSLDILALVASETLLDETGITIAYRSNVYNPPVRQIKLVDTQTTFLNGGIDSKKSNYSLTLL